MNKKSEVSSVQSRGGATFSAYLRATKARRDPPGDFVRDARGDLDMPAMRSWRQLLSYLHDCSACDEAIEAGEVVWRRYRNWRRSRT